MASPLIILIEEQLGGVEILYASVVIWLNFVQQIGCNYYTLG